MKTWLIGVGVVLLCIIAAVILYHIHGKALLTKKIAELKAQGIPTSFAELEEKYKLPEGIPNAADIYIKAFAAYQELPDLEKRMLLPVIGPSIRQSEMGIPGALPNPEKQKVQPATGQNPEPKGDIVYSQEEMAAAAEFIELNQEMFTLLHEAGKVESCYYPVDYSKVPPSLNEDIFYGAQHAGQSLRIAVIYYSRINQPEKAYNAVMDQLRLAQSLSRSPLILSHLIRLTILNDAVSGVGDDILSSTSLSQTQMQQLEAYLKQVSTSARMVPALYGEICEHLDYKNVYNIPSDNAAVDYIFDGYISKANTRAIEIIQRMIEIDKLPIQEQPHRVREVVKKISDADPSSFEAYSAKSVERCYMTHLRVRANMDYAITALAVERYRLKEEKLPETLEELVPEYLPQLYIDPFDGKPLLYKRTEPGYMIYTIGEDGVDNGGQELDKTTKTQDWAFRVYR